MSNEERQILLEMRDKIDQLLNEKFDASEKLNDVDQGQRKKAPVKHLKPKPIDIKTLYRKKGIF